MINKCRFLNPILQICSLSNAVCPFMPDPHSCPSYDEEFGQIYPSHPDWVDRLSGDIDDAESFAERMEAELNGLGVRVERIEEAPDWF